MTIVAHGSVKMDGLCNEQCGGHANYALSEKVTTYPIEIVRRALYSIALDVSVKKAQRLVFDSMTTSVYCDGHVDPRYSL
ncbi:hypothetical protein Z517_09393 [Fonsecaea pedrosoi CBS 271.37]|uniref:Uncharacterized protein n=1 Tax=Fonsecaea pedrosoi CBS 271.37 TaxID=1442368 RepID=A0A0D2GXA1_9EURO|nr:uncharacterized protein Z517_09393 [Fonsecaea pedrosoi CBS 271.37]KIW76949.1 hypothetical protein Z517_09393 [Fonsecaea pedrosoi CBS 271.37]